MMGCSLKLVAQRILNLWRRRLRTISDFLGSASGLLLVLNLLVNKMLCRVCYSVQCKLMQLSADFMSIRSCRNVAVASCEIVCVCNGNIVVVRNICSGYLGALLICFQSNVLALPCVLQVCLPNTECRACPKPKAVLADIHEFNGPLARPELVFKELS